MSRRRELWRGALAAVLLAGGWLVWRAVSPGVAASLLRACGLPQLITHDPRAYRHKLLELSAAPQSLSA